MKKTMVCLLMTAVLIAAGERHVIRDAKAYLRGLMEAQEQAAGAAPRDSLFEEAVQPVADTLDVTLYYRYGQTNVLGMESALLEAARDENVAARIVKQLVAGPDAAHGRLTGVFPRGTQVLSVTESGDTVLVTLSDDFLGRPDGAPEDWEDLALWQEEATLRRFLAAQSIICALTEGGRYQRVQLYVAAHAEDVPRRIPLCYFDLGVTDTSVVLAASSRDEAAILTPQRALQMVFSGWQHRDWERVYALLCADKAGRMPTLSAFTAQMRAADATLLTAEATFGSVDVSGNAATLMVDGAVRLRNGGDVRLIRQSVPMVRYADNWSIRLDTLLSLMHVE